MTSSWKVAHSPLHLSVRNLEFTFGRVSPAFEEVEEQVLGTLIHIQVTSVGTVCF
jgi:hypothetical protein